MDPLKQHLFITRGLFLSFKNDIPYLISDGEMSWCLAIVLSAAGLGKGVNMNVVVSSLCTSRLHSKSAEM